MDIETLLNSYEKSGDATAFFKIGQEYESQGNLELAATAYDRAYGIKPDAETIAGARSRVLDNLSIKEHGIVFRYVPAGTFLMGSEDGDPDEQPVHPVRLDAYWMSETPISWTKFCELMDFPSPLSRDRDEDWKERQSEEWLQAVYELLPDRIKQGVDSEISHFITLAYAFNVDPKICLQYCEDETLRARDWHAHIPDTKWSSGETSEDIFGVVPRENTEAERQYSQKPVVSVASYTAMALCLRNSTGDITYRLPTESEWEKAARGGLIGAKYAWGNQAPTHDICDFDRFNEFSIRKSKQFLPNGYGLYAMCGGVQEWVSDYYDSQYYKNSPKLNPTGAKDGQEYVLRGGSWADDADAVTVSYRASGRYGGSPNLGFRLCRTQKHS